MANNRLWLVHRPTGESVFLGKRMGVGWYGAHNDLGSRINEFFSTCEDKGDANNQDDFVLAIEDASDAPNATDEWVYEDHKPRLHGNR